MKNIFVTFMALGLVYACSTTPTGRKQLNFLGDGKMNTMGAQAFDQMKQERPTDPTPATNEYVKCIAIPITVEAKPFLNVPAWEIVVFKDDTANAFALPGGKIGVHTGILKVAKTPSQLAAVLGHEVGHVIAKHGAERMSQGLIAQGALTGANLFAGDSPSRAPLMAALGLGAQVGVLLPFGRKQESEADVIGLELMAKAGFDPRESTELWKNMGAASGGKQPPQFLSTHPSHESRIENLSSNFSRTIPMMEQARGQGKNPQCKL